MEKTFFFSTNLKCGGCVDKLNNVFAEVQGITSYSVDLKSALKMLEVKTTLSAPEISDLVEEAGFEAKLLAV